MKIGVPFKYGELNDGRPWQITVPVLGHDETFTCMRTVPFDGLVKDAYYACRMAMVDPVVTTETGIERAEREGLL